VNRASGIILILTGLVVLAVASLITWSSTEPASERGVSHSPGDNHSNLVAESPTWRSHWVDRSPDIAPVTTVVTLPTIKAPVVLQQRLPPIAADHATRARQLQRELKRAGCYSGEVDGVWTPAARSAMKTFLERVNAALPTHDPDHVLLALMQHHQDKACDNCPVGQGMATDGRCLPNALLAQGKMQKRSPSVMAATGWSATTTVAEPPMALGAPETKTTRIEDAVLGQPAVSRGPAMVDRRVLDRHMTSARKNAPRHGHSAVGFFQQLERLLP
jgi:hypothetical protein